MKTWKKIVLGVSLLSLFLGGGLVARKNSRIGKATGLAKTARIAIQRIVVLLRKLLFSSIIFSSRRRLMTSCAASLGVPNSAIT